MIIALAGRRHSGKTILSQILLEKGFQKLSFATKLKKITAELFDWNFDDLLSSKKDEYLPSPVVWNKEKAEQLQNKIKTNICLYKGDKIFPKIRNALTYIATEILRDTVDVDFHLKSVVEQIHEDKNYVIDDLRFLNEFKLLQSMNAICLFVFRPNYFDNYANVESEITLKRQMFDYVIINNRSKKTLIRKFSFFVNNLFLEEKEPIERQKLKSLLGHHNSKYTWNDNCFSYVNEESAYWAGVISVNGHIKKHQKYDLLLELSSKDEKLIKKFKEFIGTNKPIWHDKTRYYITTSNYYIIEDLKLWNIEPKNLPTTKCLAV